MFCPKCGNEIKEGTSFCSKCGTKVASNQENFQQNSNQSQNSQQKKNVKKHTIITKQNIGLIVGLAFMFLGGLTLFSGDVWGGGGSSGIFSMAIGAVIMFYTKGK